MLSSFYMHVWFPLSESVKRFYPFKEHHLRCEGESNRWFGRRRKKLKWDVMHTRRFYRAEATQSHNDGRQWHPSTWSSDYDGVAKWKLQTQFSQHTRRWTHQKIRENMVVRWDKKMYIRWWDLRVILCIMHTHTHQLGLMCSGKKEQRLSAAGGE